MLAPSFVVGIAHDDPAIDHTVNAVGEALRVYRRALEDGVGNTWLDDRSSRSSGRTHDDHGRGVDDSV